MKILFVNNFFSPMGGAEKVMWDEARLLRDRGCEVYFFATDKKPYFIENYKYAHYFPPHHNFRSESKLKSLSKLPHVFYNKEAEAQLALALAEIQPDIVHIHNVSYHLSPSVLAACEQACIPVVMTLHDIRMICPSASLTECTEFKGLCTTGNPMICLQKKCKNGSLSETLVSIAEYYLNRNQPLYQTVDKYITPSAALLELMVFSGMPREQLVHINNFADPNLLKKKPAHLDNGYFLYVGRLSSEKGVHYLVEAMAGLPQIQLKIVGTGPQELELIQLIETFGLENVEFLGFQSPENVIRLLSKCRATVLPCNWFENLPLSVIESMAMGKPVIASNVGGLPEMLENGKCGILLEPTDVAALQHVIELLYRKPELAKELGRLGRQRVETVYTPQAHTKQLLALYQQVLQSQPFREKRVI